MLTSAGIVAVPVAVADECPLGGGTHLYGGTQVERPLRLPEGHAGEMLHWRLAVNRTTVARGTCSLNSASPVLRLEVPEVERRVDAQLVLSLEPGRRFWVAVELHPPAASALETAFGEESVGWVGEASPLRVGGRDLVLERAPLRGPSAVRRFRGSRIVVPPETAVDDVLAAALLERAASGASVLALGVDEAPWAHAEAGLEGPVPVLADPLFEGIDARDLGAWGRGGSAWTRRLRPADGNHREWADGRVRALYPGRGQLVLAQLALLPHLDDEPLAATLLVRLLGRVRAGPPALAAPRSVVAVGGAVPAEVAALFGTEPGDGPAVVVAGEHDLDPVLAKASGPVVVLGRDGSVYSSGTERLSGPGFDADRSELLRFLTEAGIRVEAKRYWR